MGVPPPRLSPARTHLGVTPPPAGSCLSTTQIDCEGLSYRRGVEATIPAPLRGPHRVGCRNAAADSRARRPHSRLTPAPRPPALTSQPDGSASALRHRPRHAALTAAQAITRVCLSATINAREYGEETDCLVVSLQIGRDTGGCQMRTSSTRQLSGARLARDAASPEERARPSAVIAQSSRQDSDGERDHGERML